MITFYFGVWWFRNTSLHWQMNQYTVCIKHTCAHANRQNNSNTYFSTLCMCRGYKLKISFPWNWSFTLNGKNDRHLKFYNPLSTQDAYTDLLTYFQDINFMVLFSITYSRCFIFVQTQPDIETWYSQVVYTCSKFTKNSFKLRDFTRYSSYSYKI